MQKNSKNLKIKLIIKDAIAHVIILACAAFLSLFLNYISTGSPTHQKGVKTDEIMMFKIESNEKK